VVRVWRGKVRKGKFWTVEKGVQIRFFVFGSDGLLWRLQENVGLVFVNLASQPRD